MIFPMI